MAVDQAGSGVRSRRPGSLASPLTSRLLTIGVYGHSDASFLDALEGAAVDALVDVRMRRGMRGSTYAWANASRLQSLLEGRGIGYSHAKHLAPSPDIRAWQRAKDAAEGTAKRDRSHLDPGFVEMYQVAILGQLDPVATLSDIRALGRAPALLCVETVPRACHRSLIADWLRTVAPLNVEHLTP